ncbi:putative signal transducing protein [Pontimicrobium sp. IMCC45349]|uniref:putative signal transducing protein n=1 Tax=Pontimicrobium sp. IMCC45349 TaxID=3391574 RepID=UPI00399FA774
METHYTRIFTGNFITVNLIISRLEEIGIRPIIKDETESGRLAGFGPAIPGHQELFVHNDELDKAIPIVESALAELKV